MQYTKKQLEIMNFILEYQKANGVSPLLEEIARKFNVSTVTVFEHLSALEKKGAVARKRHSARSIEITDPELSPDFLTLPMLGYIVAGAPIETLEQAESFSLADLIPLDGKHYVLKVKGDSMVEDGINDGDYVIIREAKMARNGQTVVAVMEGSEATLKRFYHEGHRIRLQPANERLKPIYVNDCEIRGIVVGVFRKMMNQ